MLCLDKRRMERLFPMILAELPFHPPYTFNVGQAPTG